MQKSRISTSCPHYEGRFDLQSRRCREPMGVQMVAIQIDVTISHRCDLTVAPPTLLKVKWWRPTNGGSAQPEKYLAFATAQANRNRGDLRQRRFDVHARRG